jgi:glutamate--cysteine ligase
MSKPIAFRPEEVEDLLCRPLRETSLERVARMLTRTAKEDPADWLIGMEIELFAFHQRTLAPADYPDIVPILMQLATRMSMTIERDPRGSPTGLRGHGVLISLEPGGQIEISTSPHPNLHGLRDEVTRFVGALRDVGHAAGLGLWAIGFHPYGDPTTMPKMPKDRYDAMRSYFGKRGARALQMMHCTCSVQCALDYSDERNMADKIRTAARVSPFLSALVAASPFTHGRPNGYKTVRYQVWLETDDERCGIWPEMLDEEGLTYDRYLARAMSTPAFYFLRNGRHVLADPKPLAYYAENGFDGTTVTVNDLIQHLTTFFPEIRPKGYVEVRGADCVPPGDAIAIAGFWRGILDDEDAKREVDMRIGRLTHADLRALQPLIATQGLGAQSPIGPVAEVIEWLVDLSYASQKKNDPDCVECIDPLVERAHARRSPADVMLELAASDSIEAALETCVL